jgi:hypothetical protein
VSAQALREHVLRLRIDELAGDVGRLRRRFSSNGDELSAHLADRIASHVEALHGIVMPSAGELVAWTAPGDEEAVEEALRLVDEWWRRLEHRLGKKTA